MVLRPPGARPWGLPVQSVTVPLLGGAKGNTYTLETPGDAGKLLLGYWMLFALNSAGVLSIAETIYVLVLVPESD